MAVILDQQCDYLLASQGQLQSIELLLLLPLFLGRYWVFFMLQAFTFSSTNSLHVSYFTFAISRFKYASIPLNAYFNFYTRQQVSANITKVLILESQSLLSLNRL
jgi:hypothetical protein